MAINFILVLNRQGKTRLVKWFNNNYSLADKSRFTSEIHRLISSRESKPQSNFVEYQSNKLVYRRYAGLYFISAIGPTDNELSYLESLHFFVEILDTYFENVCELDLVLNFYKLYTILDEVYLGGEIHQISKQKVLERLAMLDALA
ncbi:AP-2 complex subunit sigma [Diutina catenulata]